jgi:hypothetical protein
VEERIEYFERMLADNPTGLLALANEYQKARRHEDEAAVWTATWRCARVSVPREATHSADQIPRPAD